MSRGLGDVYKRQHKDEYLKVTGMVARFNISSRVLQVVNTKISFDDVLDIEFCR